VKQGFPSLEHSLPAYAPLELRRGRSMPKRWEAFCLKNMVLYTVISSFSEKSLIDRSLKFKGFLPSVEMTKIKRRDYEV